jgi:hypothetical protein
MKMRERESYSKRGRERERVGERESVCVRERERESKVKCLFSSLVWSGAQSTSPSFQIVATSFFNFFSKKKLFFRRFQSKVFRKSVFRQK